jgi:MFS family permease
MSDTRVEGSAGAAGDAPVSPPRHQWRPGDRGQLAMVAFSHAIQHSYVAVLGIVYPFALVEFHSSYAVLGVILGVAGVIGGLLQGMAGLVKRASTRALLAGQNLGMAVFSGLGAASPGIALFGVARVLGGLASWPQHPVGSAHLTERVPSRRGLALAVHTTGGNVGTLLAPLAASAALAAFGWRWALGGAGAVMALGSLVTWSTVKPLPLGPVAGTPKADNPPAKVSLRVALRRRQAVAVLVAGVVSAAGRGLGVLTTYVPAYLRTGLHEPALTVGALTTVVSAGAIFGPVVSGHLSDRMGRRPVLYTLYACGAGALCAFVLIGASVWALALAGLAVGVFAFSEQPIRQALFSDALHDVSARQAFGAYFAISQSIGAAWITVLGVIITAVGFKVAFLTMGGSFVVAAAIIAYGCRT